MAEPPAEIGELQADLASVLVANAPENYASIVFRAEMRKESGKVTCWYTLPGSSVHQHLATDATEYRLCKKIRKKMAEPTGDLWKVMLLQVDGGSEAFKAQFEYEDATRWDTATYRPEQNEA
jgi:hypothetical protein